MLNIDQYKKSLLNEISKIQIKFNSRDFIQLKKDINNYISKDYHTKPGKPSLDKVNSTTETAFQRAIFNCEYSTIKIHNIKRVINWLDLEIPVTLTEYSRKKCIDLIGKINTDNKYVISELKFCNTSSNQRPEYAVFELLYYYYCILLSYINLDNHNVYHNISDREKYKWSDLLNHQPFLLVTGNAYYWDYWFKKKTHKENYKTTLLKLIDTLNTELKVDIILCKTINENFSLQKINNEPYKPSISSTTWEQIL